MTMLWQFVGLLAIHWLADFVCQTHWQASNKSKSLNALARHVASYTAVLFVGATLLLGASQAVALFILVNGILHFATDFFTSKWSSHLYARQDWHNFFVVIGLDQFIHQVTLAATFAWLVAGRY